jgi:hypothetical protein
MVAGENEKLATVTVNIVAFDLTEKEAKKSNIKVALMVDVIFMQ